jgi:hypothetical protein
MTQANFSAFERMFDRAISLIIISLGVVVAGATAFAGV